MAEKRDGRDRDRNEGLEERIIKIRRCAAVVKGGRRFSFNAMVVVGDRQGRVAWGYGKANEVPPAVEKAAKEAEKTLKQLTVRRPMSIGGHGNGLGNRLETEMDWKRQGINKGWPNLHAPWVAYLQQTHLRPQTKNGTT